MNKTKIEYRRLRKKTGASALAAALAVSLLGGMFSVNAIADTGDIGEIEEAQVSDVSNPAVLEEEFQIMDLECDDSITAAASEGYVVTDAQSDDPMVSAGLSAYAESGESGNITWNLSDSGVLTISGSGAMTDYTASNYPEWYNSRNSITSIIVEEGITDLGNMAFYDCEKVTEVSLPDSLHSMGRTTFANCYALESINIPSSVTELEYAVFADCTSLTSVSLDSIQTIGDYVFQGSVISEMVISASVTDISTLAFFNSGIENFVVSGNNSVYSEKDGVIYTDSGATLFAYPQGNSAESFRVPAGVATIGSAAFAYTKNLKAIDFPDSVTCFGDSAFQNAYAITSFTIPDSVTEVGMFTFYGCPALMSVRFGSGLTVTGYQMFRNCTSLKEIYFGDTLSELYAHTFAYCTALTEVTLPANIKTIGNGCFGFCTSLKSVTTCGLEGFIPYQSFCVCTSLANVSLNEGVTEISREAFYGCSSLTQITLPESMEFVYFSAFPTTTVITNKNTDLSPYGANGYRYLENVSISGEYNYDMAYEVLEIVNEEREAAGLSALVMDNSLLETAMQRGSELALLFSHTRPDGSSCFSANSAMYGENIAAGQTSAETVMNSWMNSEGHKANILTSSYTTVGIGCFYHNGVYYWVQNFGVGDTAENCGKPENTSVMETVSLAVGEFEEPIISSGIYWGSLESYTYEYSLALTISAIQEGETSLASVYVQNPGFSSGSALLNNEGITYTSSDTAVATVNTDGLITGVSEGRAYITASLKYNDMTENILVRSSGYETFYNGVDYSAVYDYNYYISKYADLKAAFGSDDAAALQHFVTYGMKEGRQASASFDVTSYAYKYSDLRRAYKNDLASYYIHYVKYGQGEGREATGTTTMQNCLSTYNTVNYSAVYDGWYYISKYSDLKKAFGFDDEALLKHFISCGMKEGRQASEAFNVTSYAYKYSDLRRAYKNDLASYYTHYMNYGKKEGREATGTTAMQNCAVTYNGVNYSAVYDGWYYLSKYADLKKAFGFDDTAALEHFVTYGMKEGRQASASFNVTVYKNNYADLRNAFGGDLKQYYIHYMNYGQKEERDAV